MTATHPNIGIDKFTQVSAPSPRFTWVTGVYLLKTMQLKKAQQETIRRDFPESIYWFQYNRRYFYNFELVRDRLINGNSPAHTRLVQSFVDEINKPYEDL